MKTQTDSIGLNISSKDQKEKDYWKRDPYITLGAQPEQPLAGRVDSPNDSGEKVVLVGLSVVVAETNSVTTSPSSDVPALPESQPSRYSEPLNSQIK